MNDPAPVPREMIVDKGLLPANTYRLMLALSPTVVVGSVAMLDLVDMARGIPIRNSLLFGDLASTVFSGLGAWNNLSVVEAKGNPAGVGTVLTNVLSSFILLVNAIGNDQGGYPRQVARGMSLPLNIASASIILNEDKLIPM
jgi:hypothetical protein